MVKNQGTKQRGQRTLGDCWQRKANGQCSKGDNCSSRHDINKRAKSKQPNPPPSSFMQQNERHASKTRSAHRRVDEQPSKRSKKNGDKSAVAMLKMYELHDRTDTRHAQEDEQNYRTEKPVVYDYSSNTRQLGCVFQDMEPPKSSSILRKSSDMQKPIQRVKFTKAIARHAYTPDKNPSLGLICPGEPHQRSPNAPKFEDRSQEETEWQEQGAREAVWRLTKSVLQIRREKQSNILLIFGK